MAYNSLPLQLGINHQAPEQLVYGLLNESHHVSLLLRQKTNPLFALLYHVVHFHTQEKLDGCIVWNAHKTVLGSKRLAICATV